MRISGDISGHYQTSADLRELCARGGLADISNIYTNKHNVYLTEQNRSTLIPTNRLEILTNHLLMHSALVGIRGD